VLEMCPANIILRVRILLRVSEKRLVGYLSPAVQRVIMKLLLVCVLLACALSMNLKEGMQTATVEEATEEMGTTTTCEEGYTESCDSDRTYCTCIRD